MKQMVKVVIPLYKKTLADWEIAALKNNVRQLRRYPVTFLIPEGIFPDVLEAYPSVERIFVSQNWLGSRRGIAGYNAMMMSASFYALFSDVEYVLICHTDAWIFRDELDVWCRKDYDSIAAPWPLRPLYKHFPFSVLLQARKALAHSYDGLTRFDMYGQVGNGGLCLRRVGVFREACMEYASDIAHFNALDDSLHNEDIFWALIPKTLRIPDVSLAVRFSFDLKPRVCYRMNGGRLPMGCHGFMHKSRVGFWKNFIPCIENG